MNRSKARVYLAMCMLIMTVVYSNQQGSGSEDDHGHSHENPSYKYSRAANEKAAHAHAHAHSHGGDAAHAHAHSHGAGAGHHHGHVHSHGGAGGGHHHGHSHEEHDDHHGHHHSHEQPKKRAAEPSTTTTTTSRKADVGGSIMLNALGSTALISVAPFLILFFIPINDNKDENQALLKVMLAFASGSLLGDAFLHLIPHALEPHHDSDHSHSHSHSHGGNDAHGHDHSQQTNVGLWVMGGILTFLLVEKLIMSLNNGEHTHSHSASKDDKKPKKSDAKSSDQEEEEEDKGESDKDSSSKSKKEEGARKKKKEDEASKKVEKKKEEKTKEEKHEGIKVAGYLNLAADFAHNFTDGLAIGASYLAGRNLGIITTFTILFHEVPHEIGDFAILIQSGCSKKKAMLLQLVTALGALSGTVLSLLFESAVSGFATSCILPFTAGGFIYIATVTIIPELKENGSLWQSIKEIFALVAGVMMMIIISYYE